MVGWQNNSCRRTSIFLFLIATSGVCSESLGVNQDPELQKFQGHWEVTDLIEDGKVIPRERIRELLPSGGRAHIIENAIIFKSVEDGRQRAKVFRIDPAKYPKRIEITASQGKDSWGIYQFDAGKLIICVTDPDQASRPDDFSAEADSNRMMMILRRMPGNRPVAKAPAKPPAKKSQIAPSLRGLTDAQLTKMLAGTWRLKDNAGFLFVTFHSNGTVSTVREYQELRLFHKSFVQTPVSDGTWNIKNGELTTHITRSARVDRVNRQFSFTIRSISDADLIFMDSLGRVVQAVRAKRF